MDDKKEDIYLDIEADLDEEVIDQFTIEIERTVNMVANEYIASDVRPELLTVLTTFAAQMAMEVGIDKDKFLKLSEELYQEIERLCFLENEDKSKMN